MALRSPTASSSTKASWASFARSSDPVAVMISATEPCGQLVEQRRAGPLQLVDDRVGVDDHRAAARQQLGDGRLPRADATGQADDDHRPVSAAESLGVVVGSGRHRADVDCRWRHLGVTSAALDSAALASVDGPCSSP